MTEQRFIRQLGPQRDSLLAAAACLALSVSGWCAETPNVVLIYADDIGYGDVSCYGATAVTTPHMDRLASNGLKFTSAYAVAATCTPSRYSLLTGEYSFRRAGTGILPGDAKLIIRPGRETVPAMLKRAGYRTAVVGKWHLGLGEGDGSQNWNEKIQPGPNEVGFDHSFIMAATGDRVPCVYVENGHVVGLEPDDPIEVDYKTAFPGEPTGKTHRDRLVMDWSHGHNDSIVNGISRIGHMRGGKAALWQDAMMAKDFTRHAVQFIEETREQPFFLFFAAHDNHVPRVPNEEFVGKTKMGPRGDAIVEFDWMVGQVISTLERLNLLKNSLVIVTSDNGPVLDDGYKDGAAEWVGDHTPSGPWRGGKYSLFEGGTRMPFIVHWPARVKPGVSEALISQVDLLGTLAALTGQSFNAEEAPDTQNQLAALLGEAKNGRASLVQSSRGSPRDLAYRQGEWKYIPPGRTRDQLGPWTNVRIPEPGWLFHLTDDPGETNNLATSEIEKLRELQAGLLGVREQALQSP